MKVEWSEQAINRATETMVFMEEKFSLRAAQKFHLRLWDALLHIEKYPTTGQPSAKIAGVRSLKIDKYRRLFYFYDEPVDSIIVLDVFDLRQHPMKLKY